MARTKKPTSKSKKSRSKEKSRLLWIGLGAVLVLVVVIALIFSNRKALPFEKYGGDNKPLVVLRSTSTVYYPFRYTGDRPAKLERLIPRIQENSDQELVADLDDLSVHFAGRTIDLADGYLPEDQPFELQPGDVFELSVVYPGQEMGWNLIVGFEIQYNIEGVSVNGELELTDNDNNFIFVE